MDEIEEITDYLDQLIEKAEKALAKPDNNEWDVGWWEGYKRAAENAKEFVEDWSS